ncbi:MAG: DUF937 domain-containing protein [Saprospiraceae bacterium]
MDLSSLLTQTLSEGTIDQLSNQLGTDRQTTAKAAAAGVSALMGAMARNASTPDGAQALAGALERDHDGSVVDNLGSLLGGGGALSGMLGGLLGNMMGGGAPAPQAPQPKALDGAGILGHILGGQQGGVIDAISKMSGLSQGKTGQLLLTLAPIIMGMLGKQKRSNNLDSGGLSDLLTNMMSGSTAQQRQSPSNPALDMATRFLDKDGDGSALDDIAGIGSQILGGFFKR